VLLCDGPVFGPEHLSLGESAPSIDRESAPAPSEDRPLSGLTEELRATERERILEALDRCAGNQTRAATMLGISRRALIHRLESYGVPRPRKRD
jgi:DNA-binding NtrC family response regulator